MKNPEKRKKIFPVKLICGIIYSPEINIPELERYIETQFQLIQMRSQKIDWNFSKYYSKEMGTNLKRYWLSFSSLISPDEIVKMKKKAMEIESKFSIDGKRRANLDPGYISAANLILSTTKNYAHRIYLSEGIYAEVTLIYRNKRFNYLEWTYPDYKIPLAIDFFEKVREKYLEELKNFVNLL